MRHIVSFITIMLTVLLASNIANATDVSITYIDTISETDTTAEDAHADTLYSAAARIDGFRFLSFYTTMFAPPAKTDSNFTGDTFFVSLQHSYDKANWITFGTDVDTLLDTARAISPLIIDRDASALGAWGRLRFIHWDSTEADVPGIFGNTYSKKVTLWISGN